MSRPVVVEAAPAHAEAPAHGRHATAGAPKEGPDRTAIDAASAALPPSPAWAYTVSVRSLCEFTAKEGDLDRRFTPSATALEGQLGQQTVAARRGPDYQVELSLEGRHGPLRVRGRADGYDPRRRCLEEIKTVRGHPDALPANRRLLHWAQLQTYGALYCRLHGLDELALTLVYFDAASKAEVELHELCSAQALDAAFVARCEQFTAWARQEALHRTARDASLRGLRFPEPAFRPGQRTLAEAVYRAAVGGRCLLAQAPTGIGKTVGTLFPMLRAMPVAGLDKLAFLTCKGTARLAALEALRTLVGALPAGPADAPQGASVAPAGPALDPSHPAADPTAAEAADDAFDDPTQGAAAAHGTPLAPTTAARSTASASPPLRVLTLVAKEQACEHPGKACHAEACPLAQGFYDRLAAAREEAVATAWLDAPAQRRIALRHGLCPYYLGQELMRWADVLVGDVHHAFDPHGQLWGLAEALDWRVGVLVDEAHNLIERTRQMHSVALSLEAVREALRGAPVGVRAAIGKLRDSAVALAAEQAADHAVLEALPERWLQALQAASLALGEHFQSRPAATGPLLNFHFELLRFLRLAEAFGEHSLFEVQRVGPADRVGVLGAVSLAGGQAPDRGPSSVGLRGVPGAVARSERSDGEGPAPDGEDGIGPAHPPGLDSHGLQALFGLRNVVPARFLRPRFAALHSVTLFSATLGPPAYPRDLLGLPEATAWLDVPSAFPAHHLRVQVADGVSTRFLHRARSLDRLVDVIERQYDAHPGNYLVFFSSLAYLRQAAARLAERRPDIVQWQQGSGMSVAQRQDFLDRFVPDGRGLGFAALGGVFGEGVDLPGTRLVGAFIATLGLPPVSVQQEQVKARLDRLFGSERGYADLVPAMQKVVQAAGRVLRTPEDRGWLWLMDDRYGRPEVRRLLPAWWDLDAAARR